MGEVVTLPRKEPPAAVAPKRSPHRLRVHMPGQIRTDRLDAAWIIHGHAFFVGMPINLTNPKPLKKEG